MDLTVLIVSFRGWDKLNLCLESLEKFSSKRFSVEVIVVDNNSCDSYLETIEKSFSNFRFIKNPVNGGYANGCNLGFSFSEGKHILILNPDTVVSEEAIGELLERSNHNPEYSVVSCRQVRSDGRETKPWGIFPGLFAKRKEVDESHDNMFFPDWVSGSLMLIHREIFKKLNGFDEDFWMYYEDVDLCKRASNEGGKIVLFNDITIVHNHGGSSRINLRTAAITKSEVQISKHLYFHKHKSGTERFLLQCITLADNLISGLLSGTVGLLLFFIPKLFVRFLLFIRLLSYYTDAVLRKSWLSRRSVRFR
jgi:hypothetical protein